MTPNDFITAEPVEMTTEPIERLTEAQYLERAQRKAIEVAAKIQHDSWVSVSHELPPAGYFFLELIRGSIDKQIIELFETAKQQGWYEKLQDIAADIVMAAAVCQDPQRANFYGAIAGVARGTHHDDMIRFIKGAKP